MLRSFNWACVVSELLTMYKGISVQLSWTCCLLRNSNYSLETADSIYTWRHISRL